MSRNPIVVSGVVVYSMIYDSITRDVYYMFIRKMCGHDGSCGESVNLDEQSSFDKMCSTIEKKSA